MKKSTYQSSLWSANRTSISFLVPTRDTVHSHFAFSLAQLVKTTTEIGHDVYVFFDSNTILLNQRENLIERAKEVRSDYVLWLDSDMVFPSTTVARLLAHNKEIVACNYMKRSLPLKTVAYSDINDWDSWIPLTTSEELVEVEGVGMGCVLMKTNIFEEINKPYFEFTYTRESGNWHGEDFNLFRKFREVGYTVYVDTVLSLDIKHIGIYAFGKNNPTS